MKKTALFALVLAAAACFSACGEKNGADETTAEPDWRNRIEYEGSFFVSEDIKLLYALDTGSITLWDSSGDGEKLQVLKYNSAEPDAIERLERSDVNGDGFTDLRVVYSEKNGNICYNLWLWSKTKGLFAECGPFRAVSNPVFSDDGTVSSETDLGIFGSASVVYRFTDELLLEIVSKTVNGTDDTAAAIATQLFSSGEVSVMDGVATIDDMTCVPYSVTSGGKAAAYVAYSPDGDWFCDPGCIGIYRRVDDNDGKFCFGMYTGLAATAEELAIAVTGCDSVQITAAKDGMIDICPAEKFDMTLTGGSVTGCALVGDKNNQWYYTVDNSEYYIISGNDGTLGEKAESAFY